MPVARFTKAEITRAVEAAKACGLVVAGVEITADCTIRVLTTLDEKSEAPQPTKGPKKWS